jgi:hypothetical protein
MIDLNTVDDTNPKNTPTMTTDTMYEPNNNSEYMSINTNSDTMLNV